jgi:hypothetical protein
MYLKKRILFTYGSDCCRKKKTPHVRTPWYINRLRRRPESRDATMQCVMDSHREVIHVIIDICFTFRDARWCIVWPSIVFATTTFLSFRSSQADVPTSSSLHTNVAFIPSTYSRTWYVVSSRKARETSNLGSSWDILLVSAESSRWHKTQEPTPPQLTKQECFVSP